MIINPRTVYERFLIEKCKNTKIQVNGVDLAVEEIKEVVGKAVISENGLVLPKVVRVKRKDRYFLLQPNKAYDITFCEVIKVPHGASGFIIQRSTLNRCGCRILSSWYDSGFVGKVGAIMTTSLPVKIKEGTRIAQLIMLKSDNTGLYNGKWKYDRMTRNKYKYKKSIKYNKNEVVR